MNSNDSPLEHHLGLSVQSRDTSKPYYRHFVFEKMEEATPENIAKIVAEIEKEFAAFYKEKEASKNER